MSWAYIITFNDHLGTRSDVQNALDSMEEVTYWYACMPHCVFFTSTVSAEYIAKRIRERFGTSSGQRFLVAEIHEDRQGWLPNQAWHLFRHPDNPRKENS